MPGGSSNAWNPTIHPSSIVPEDADLDRLDLPSVHQLNRFILHSIVIFNPKLYVYIKYRGRPQQVLPFTSLTKFISNGPWKNSLLVLSNSAPTKENPPDPVHPGEHGIRSRGLSKGAVEASKPRSLATRCQRLGQTHPKKTQSSPHSCNNQPKQKESRSSGHLAGAGWRFGKSCGLQNLTKNSHAEASNRKERCCWSPLHHHVPTLQLGLCAPNRPKLVQNSTCNLQGSRYTLPVYATSA